MEYRDDSWLTDEELMQLLHNPDYVADGLTLHLIEQALATMERKGINLTDLARRMVTTRAYAQRIFRQPLNMTLRQLIQIAIALNMQVDANLRDRDAGS